MYECGRFSTCEEHEYGSGRNCLFFNDWNLLPITQVESEHMQVPLLVTALAQVLAYAYVHSPPETAISCSAWYRAVIVW